MQNAGSEESAVRSLVDLETLGIDTDSEEVRAYRTLAASQKAETVDPDDRICPRYIICSGACDSEGVPQPQKENRGEPHARTVLCNVDIEQWMSTAETKSARVEIDGKPHCDLLCRRPCSCAFE